MQKLVGDCHDFSQSNLAGILRDFCSEREKKTKALNFGEKFGAFFSKKIRSSTKTFRAKFARSKFCKTIRSSTKIFRAKFALQTCHLDTLANIHFRPFFFLGGGGANQGPRILLCFPHSGGSLLNLYLVVKPLDPPLSRAIGYSYSQQVLNPTPLNPTPATCHKRKRKLCCNFRNAALRKLHCRIGFSAVRMSF